MTSERLHSIFKPIEFCDCTTWKKLHEASSMTSEYKNHTIALGFRKSGNFRGYTVRVYRNEDNQRIGEFALDGLCASDSEAIALARRWACETIDNRMKED